MNETRRKPTTGEDDEAGEDALGSNSYKIYVLERVSLTDEICRPYLRVYLLRTDMYCGVIL